MVNCANPSLYNSSTIADACAIFDACTGDVLPVLSASDTAIGHVCDFDVRKFILGGGSLEESIINVLCSCAESDELHSSANSTGRCAFQQFTSRSQQQQALIGEDGPNKIAAARTVSETRDNLVVLMVGGAGTRLRPLTDNCPKPLLPVKGKPLLERTIEHLSSFGFRRFCFAVGYMADTIIDYFQDGARWGIQIDYVREHKRLGTCGALRLLPRKPRETLLVMNGDLITGVKYDNLLRYHQRAGAKATLCVSGYEVAVPYGVVDCDGIKMASLREKPVNKYWISAGIYLLEPETIELIPDGGQEYDMPTLLQSVASKFGNVSVYPIREKWIDIGSIDEYERANSDDDDSPPAVISRTTEIEAPAMTSAAQHTLATDLSAIADACSTSVSLNSLPSIVLDGAPINSGNLTISRRQAEAPAKPGTIKADAT